MPTFGDLYHAIAILNIGPPEMLVLLVVGLLIFGRRLPEVGRSLGKTLMEFRQGLQNLKDEVVSNEDIQETRRSLQDIHSDMHSLPQYTEETFKPEYGLDHDPYHEDDPHALDHDDSDVGADHDSENLESGAREEQELQEEDPPQGEKKTEDQS